LGPDRLVAWAVLCGATAACAAPGASGSVGSSASCAGPYVEVAPRQAQPGDRVSLRGEGHVDGCDDTGQSEPVVVLQDLPVTLRQGAATWQLDRVDATAPGGVVAVTITVPVDARPGTAEVTVGAAAAVITIGPPDAPAWLQDPDGTPTVRPPVLVGYSSEPGTSPVPSTDPPR
jgi:hypothetical protein